ncbi:MAG TPA: CoA-binding protein [Vicinamibacterales bacterium]|nr:CoA-binding protein [Vicinamibacterales bacterium]
MSHAIETTARSIHRFLAEPAVAIVGVSSRGRKFGNLACRTLREKGYRVYPIHPRAATIDGMRCYARFGALPESVDAVLVVVPPEAALTVIRDAKAAGIRRVWLQQGAESQAAVELAQSLGMEVVAGECILMFANPTGVHRVHRAIRKMFGGLPV